MTTSPYCPPSAAVRTVSRSPLASLINSYPVSRRRALGVKRERECRASSRDDIVCANVGSNIAGTTRVSRALCKCARLSASATLRRGTQRDAALFRRLFLSSRPLVPFSSLALFSLQRPPSPLARPGRSALTLFPLLSVSSPPLRRCRLVLQIPWILHVSPLS